MTYETLKNLSIKGLCVAIRNAANVRDRINAAEMLHARVIELGESLSTTERFAILDTCNAVAA